VRCEVVVEGEGVSFQVAARGSLGVDRESGVVARPIPADDPAFRDGRSGAGT
jgi:hypothetical protein